MRPTELMPKVGPPVVGAMSVTDENPHAATEQLPCGIGRAPGVDHENGDGRRDDGPQKCALTSLSPTGFVGVLDRLLDDERLGFVDRRLECRARDVLTPDNGPHGHAQPEHVAHQFGHRALTQPIDPHQHGDHSDDA